MCADPYPGGRGHQVALVVGQVEPDPVGVLGQQRGEHGLEVRQRPRGEVVPLSRLHVERVELRPDLDAALRDLDSGLGRLLDVAPPQLVHPGQQLLRRLGRERELEHKPRLAGGEALVVIRRPPAEAAHRLRVRVAWWLITSGMPR